MKFGPEINLNKNSDNIRAKYDTFDFTNSTKFIQVKVYVKQS